MRFDSTWHLVLIGCSLATVLSPSHVSGNDGAGTVTQPTAAIEAASTPPSPPTTPPQAFPRVGATARTFAYPLLEPQVTNQTRQALSFYGGYSARATLSQLPRRTPIRPNSSSTMAVQPKPFEGVFREPTVSPYLNLYRDEDNAESAPNYFAFVRPQFEQLEANRMQAREIRQLRGQLQGMGSTVAGPRYQAAGMPGTGSAARYMDTAQFYGGWRR
jgi:hypothetical protein